MSYKLGTSLSYAFFAVIGIWFYYSSSMLPAGRAGNLGPGFFGQALSILLIISCIVGAITNFRSQDSKVIMPKLSYVLVVIIPATLLVVAWKYTGNFFIPAFVMIFIQLFFFGQKKLSFKPKLFIKPLIISSIITLSVYVIFDVLLNINF